MMTAYEMRISDWSSDVCCSDLCSAERRASRQDQRQLSTGKGAETCLFSLHHVAQRHPANSASPPDIRKAAFTGRSRRCGVLSHYYEEECVRCSSSRIRKPLCTSSTLTRRFEKQDRKSTRLNSSHYC